MRLVVAETARQARRARDLGADEVLCLLPEASWELERAGVPHRRLCDVASDESFEVVCASTADTARLVASDLDEAAGSKALAWGLMEPDIKRLLDAVLGRGALLREALDTLRPREVVSFGGPAAPPSLELAYDRGSPWDPVLTVALPQAGIEHRRVPDRSAAAAYRPHGIRLWKRWEGWPRTLAARMRARRRFASAGRPRADASPVLVGTLPGPAVQHAAEQAAAQGHPIVYWPGAGRPVSLFGGRTTPRRHTPYPGSARGFDVRTAARRRREPSPVPPPDRFADSARLGEIDLSDPVRERLTAFAQRWWPWLSRAMAEAMREVEFLEPAVLVTGGTKHWWERRVKLAARAFGVPVVSFQHGGGPGTLDPAADAYRAAMDLEGADVYVAWGRGVIEDFCSSAVPRPRGVIAPPPALEKLRASRPFRSSRPDGPLRVLYAPTDMAAHLRSGPAAAMEDTAAFALQRTVATAVLTDPRTELCIKPAAPTFARNPLGEWARGHARLRIEEGTPLASLFRRCDAIVLDWPFTTLLEAVATDLPVLCIADGRTVRLRGQAEELLRRRAELATRSEQVEAAVKRLLAGARQMSRPPDDAFLERYGLGEPSGDWWPAAVS